MKWTRIPPHDQSLFNKKNTLYPTNFFLLLVSFLFLLCFLFGFFLNQTKSSKKMKYEGNNTWGWVKVLLFLAWKTACTGITVDWMAHDQAQGFTTKSRDQETEWNSLFIKHLACLFSLCFHVTWFVFNCRGTPELATMVETSSSTWRRPYARSVLWRRSTWIPPSGELTCSRCPAHLPTCRWVVEMNL